MTYPNLTLPQLLERSAKRYPKRTALFYFGARLSYADLAGQVRRCAAGLQVLGIKPGQRVALLLPNCPQFVIAYFGILQAGGIVTATSTMYTPREAAHQWRDAGISGLIADRDLYPMAKLALKELTSPVAVVVTRARDYYPAKLGLQLGAPNALAIPKLSSRPVSWTELMAAKDKPRVVRGEPSAIACLQYTGGTTGVSKGAMLTHANLVSNSYQMSEGFGLHEDRLERSVAALPLFHIYAMTCVMISGVAIAGAVIILPRFELKAALDVVRKHAPTLFHGVPTMYVAFNQAPNVKRYRFHSLRSCMSGGAPLPLEVRLTFEKLTGGALREGYGLTEASPVTHLTPIHLPCKEGSVGRVVPKTKARIVDVRAGKRELPLGEAGELVIRGPQVMKGYWKHPKESARALRGGWLHTGDIAKRDADGYYWIVDRKKDMIIAGGYNIYPREVEEVLFEHPAVAEAVVIGVPDSYRGETVKAFIVLKKKSQVSNEAILAFCRKRLAGYKVPRLVEFRDALPKSAVGKHLRRELRAEETLKEK